MPAVSDGRCHAKDVGQISGLPVRGGSASTRVADSRPAPPLAAKMKRRVSDSLVTKGSLFYAPGVKPVGMI